MKRLLLIGFLMTLATYSSGQKKPVEKRKVIEKKVGGEKKPDVVTQFRNLVAKIDNRFKTIPVVLTYQDFSTSPSGFIFYKLQFERLESSFDVQTTNSLVTPYTGYIVLKLKVKTNAKSGDVKGNDYNVGFSDSTKAKQNDNYETCIDPKYDFNQWCVGEIKISYAYQDGKWIFKSIDTEVPNKIGNGTTRGDIQNGVLDKLLTE